jgi:hypothetical protein
MRLLLAALILALAGPAAAQSSAMSFVLNGEIIGQCAVSGYAYTAAGQNSGRERIELGEVGASRVDLADNTDQTIGEFTAVCNVGSATVAIETVNDFALRNETDRSTGDIRYSLKIPEVAQLSSGFIRAERYSEGLEPGVSLRRTIDLNVGRLDFTRRAPGVYADLIQLSISPNP